MVAIARGDAGEGRSLLIETAAILSALSSRPIGQSLIEVAAGLAALQEAWAQAARYFGIAEAQARRTGMHRDPTDEAFLAPRIDAAREGLGKEAFAAAEAAGRTLSYEVGIEEVRSWLEGRAR